MNWRGRRVAVVGLGVSNMAVVRHLHRRGASIVGFDRKTADQLGDAGAALQALDIPLHLGPDYLERLVAEKSWDAVVLTPGLPKGLPALARLKERGVPFYSEIGLFFSLCPAPVIGITGSSGKTTTTTLVGEMLRQGDRPVYVGGNIGTPLLDVGERIEPDAWVVLELSSFQLEMLDVSPRVAVVTNITPNHLDVHETMDAYVAAKRRIFAFQRPGDWVLLNGDDPRSPALAEGAPGDVATFRRKGPAAAFVEKGYIVVETPEGGRLAICPVDDVALPGSHNVENVLAAAAVAVRCGISAEGVRRVVTTFEGVPHRLEFVGESDGVRYYNDSIATSPARAVAGVHAFDDPVVLIAGGYDKRLPFDELADAVVHRVRALVLVGNTAPTIEAAVQRRSKELGRPGPRVRHAVTFDEAVHLAREMAEPGDVVLLSPACASYDMFPNFAVRGERFRTVVQSFVEERKTADAGRQPVRPPATYL